MGGSSESFTAPSAGGVDVTVIFEGPISTSGVCVAGGGTYFFSRRRSLRKTLPLGLQIEPFLPLSSLGTR